MRVTLVHNPDAGSGDHLGSELLARLREAGHEPAYASTEAASLTRALKAAPDVVLAAGGDGTVGAVARLMAATTPDIPLAILPVGTANNLARSLGVSGTADEIIAGLESGATRRLDIATVSAPWGTARFVESAGVGAFGAMLRDADREDAAESATPTKPNVRGSRLRRVLQRTRPRHWRIDADGEDLSGTYLLALALNIGYVGPGLALAPGADPGDGQLDLLLIGEGDRDTLGDYLARLSGPEEPTLAIATRRATRTRMEWSAASGHVDDHIWPERSADAERPSAADRMIEIDAIGSSISVLVPRANHPTPADPISRPSP
jgi:diacylglycerol kinase (ATP)